MENKEMVPAGTKIKEGLGGREVMRSASTAAELVAEQTRAEVFGAMTLAKQFPRDENKAREDIIQTCKSIKFADKAIYKKPVGGGKTIEGASIRLAEEVLRLWGNIKSYKFIIYDDPTRRMLRIVCYDLEKNTSYSEDAVIEKTVERKNAKGREVISERVNSYGDVVHLVVATEDELLNKEGAKTSKLVRNTGLRLIPAHIKEEAMAAAKQVIKVGLSSNIDASIKKLVESFKGLNISSADLEKYLGHPLTQISVEEIMDLKTVYRGIKDGEAKWSDFVTEGEIADDKTETADLKPDDEDWDELEKNLDKGDPESHQAVDKPVKEKE